MVTVFTLQNFGSIPAQVMALAAILAVGIGISIVSKRKRNWTRKNTGWKGSLSAVGALLFVGYAICSFAIYFAPRRDIELTGSFLTQALTALSEPMIFASFMPFIFLGIYSAASSLGLTDLPEPTTTD